jgi:hypothetical protein
MEFKQMKIKPTKVELVLMQDVCRTWNLEAGNPTLPAGFCQKGHGRS